MKWVRPPPPRVRDSRAKGTSRGRRGALTSLLAMHFTLLPSSLPLALHRPAPSPHNCDSKGRQCCHQKSCLPRTPPRCPCPHPRPLHFTPVIPKDDSVALRKPAPSPSPPTAPLALFPYPSPPCPNHFTPVVPKNTSVAPNKPRPPPHPVPQ